MRLLNPEMWWLIPLVTVPVLIHLLVRRRPPQVPWAAMRFLLKALQRNRRKRLLETILLLIVRTGLLAVMVLMVLRPVTRAAWGGLDAYRPRTAAVIVLDDSVGMAASDGVRTRFERAVARIEQYLAELPAGSEVGVVFAARPPVALDRVLQTELGFLRQTLNRRMPRDGALDAGAAIDAAGRLLATSRLPHRELVMVTDARAAAWEPQLDRARSALAAAGGQAAAFLLLVPPTPPANVAVVGLDLFGGPDGRIASLATIDGPVRVQVRLRSHHETEPVRTGVELIIDGRKVDRRLVEVAPGRETFAAFEHRFTTAGPHVLTARCDTDRFDRDNARHLVVDVRDRIGAILIDGRSGTRLVDTATGFIRLALWPADPDDAASPSLLDARTVSGGGLEGPDVESARLFIVADVAAMPASDAARVRAAVQRGAGLMVIAGPQTTPAGLRALLAGADGDDAPLRFGEPVRLADDAEPLRLIPVNPVPEPLEVFEEPALAEALSRVAIRYALPITEAGGAEKQVWARFDRGGAALVAGRMGAGRFACVGTTADRRGGEFPLSPAFVPFFQQIALWLIEDAGGAAVIAGDPLTWPVSQEGVELRRPDGSTEPADLLMSVDPRTGERGVRLPAAERAGIYALQSARAPALAATSRRAVNVAEDAPDLAMMGPDRLAEALGGAGVTVVAAESSLREAIRSSAAESELWRLGLALLGVLLAAELILVRVFAPRPVDTPAVLARAMGVQAG